jgi:hypothetical protein
MCLCLRLFLATFFIFEIFFKCTESCGAGRISLWISLVCLVGEAKSLQVLLCYDAFFYTLVFYLFFQKVTTLKAIKNGFHSKDYYILLRVVSALKTFMYLKNDTCKDWLLFE